MAQFRFRTRKILWLGNYAVPLPYNQFSTTWSFAVPLPYKSFDFKSRSFASAQRIFCDLSSIVSLPHKEYTMSRSSAVLLRTICDLKFRSFAQYTVTWISAVSLPQEKTSFEIPHFASAREHYFSLENPLSFNHPPISWRTLWRTEKQRNEDGPGKSRR